MFETKYEEEFLLIKYIFKYILEEIFHGVVADNLKNLHNEKKKKIIER